MSAIGRLSQRKAVQRLSGVVPGAKLIARRWYTLTGTFNDTVPVGAGWISVRVAGSGSYATNGSYASGSGAFSREDRECSPGQSTSAVIVYGNDDAANLVKFSLAGVLICAADSGKPNGNGGLASAGTGTIKKGGSYYGQPGDNGGAPGTQSPYSGAGAAGERTAFDCLLPGGNGGANGDQAGSVGNGYGGGAGTSGIQYSTRHGNVGAIVAEFWTRKP